MIIREIGTIARSLEFIANKEFREMNLARGQYVYLVRIAEHPGIIQEELAELVNMDRSTVARAVQKLEQNGLVTRSLEAGNQKNKPLYVTQKGKACYQVVQEEHTYSENRCLSVLTSEEAQQLATLLAKVRVPVVEDWTLVKQGGKRDYKR